jgi:beta-N-acetylhexosaminidase
MRGIGQLFFTGITGLALTEAEKAFIEAEEIGGVLLFSRNYESPGQLAELINSIQVLRQEYPLFIAVDQEGGRVQRFKAPFSVFPSAEDMAMLDSPKTVYEIHRILAEELKICGVNVNFAPCVDIVTSKNSKAIGDRSFGNNPETVEKFISAAIRGLQTSNVLACVKHFPGHGATIKDTHEELPTVTKTLEELKNWDLLPFIKAVKSRSEFVMMSHMLVEAFDKKLPCSLSKACYDYLRTDLKYTKIIVTDDMQMGAIEKHFGLEEAGVLAFSAGADMLEYRDFEKTVQVYGAVRSAIAKNKLDKKSMEAKMARVKDCKKKYFSDFQPTFIPNISKVIGLKSSKIFCEDLMTKISRLKEKTNPQLKDLKA